MTSDHPSEFYVDEELQKERSNIGSRINITTNYKSQHKPEYNPLGLNNIDIFDLPEQKFSNQMIKTNIGNES